MLKNITFLLFRKNWNQCNKQKLRIIKCLAWPTYHQDKHSDKVSTCSSWKCGFQSVNKISLQFYLVTWCKFWCRKARKTWVGALTAVIWPKLLKVALNSKQTNKQTKRPCDLVFDLKWPSFELVKDFMEMNVLIHFHED